ncbi:hypothetical protein G3435_26070 [Pseudomonas sp. MAFF212428]|uniref:Dermonecrotic toxin N-terminal domain-containing protein n=1 Tax=Pseudomonas brassicae TaxID=2708063 RepID=A0A6M0D7G9_9PSED|nr:hypothetical protein [Pseudomonas brassicae]
MRCACARTAQLAQPGERRRAVRLPAGLGRQPVAEPIAAGLPVRPAVYSRLRQGPRQARLDQDFAAGRYPADELFVTTTRWITALPPPGEVPSGDGAASVRHRQTLIEYALNHYRDWDHAITAIELKGDMTLPARIDAAYLHALVRELDLGAGYQQLLEQRLAPSHPDYPKRLVLFCRQLPGQLLEAAWRARLKGELSATAVDCIRAVLEQPDATARGLQPAPAAQLLPLELIADSDMPPDTVPGIYLFMHQGPTPGPVVMYIPYEADGMFRSFSSPARPAAIRAQDRARAPAGAGAGAPGRRPAHTL